MRNFMVTRNIISDISVFTLLVAMINIVLSLLVYFFLPFLSEGFLNVRWEISIAIVCMSIVNNRIVINDLYYKR